MSCPGWNPDRRGVSNYVQLQLQITINVFKIFVRQRLTEIVSNIYEKKIGGSELSCPGWNPDRSDCVVFDLESHTLLSQLVFHHNWLRPANCGGLMVSLLVSGSRGLGSSPDRGHCVVFLRTFSASLHPGLAGCSQDRLALTHN